MHSERERSTWCSTQEAAARLGLTPSTVYALANRGELACYRFGRVYRFRSEDVEAFIDARRVRPGELDHLVGKRARRKGGGG